MDLEARVPAVEGRTHAEAGDRVVPDRAIRLPPSGAHRVDAVRRPQPTPPRLEVGGWIAEPAAAPVALDHPTLDHVRVIQERARQGGVARLDRGADPARRADLAAPFDPLDPAHAEAIVLAERRQGLGIAGALVAEAEVGADHHVARAEPAGEDVVDELLRRLPHQERGEREREQVLDPELGQEARLDPEGGQPGRRARRGQDLARVRLEGDHAERRAQRPRLLARGPDQRAVAAVHAVEVADRDHAMERGLRQAPVAPVDLHGPPYARRLPWV